jgi:hypothetical protein
MAAQEMEKENSTISKGGEEIQAHVPELSEISKSQSAENMQRTRRGFFIVKYAPRLLCTRFFAF